MLDDDTVSLCEALDCSCSWATGVWTGLGENDCADHYRGNVSHWLSASRNHVWPTVGLTAEEGQTARAWRNRVTAPGDISICNAVQFAVATFGIQVYSANSDTLLEQQGNKSGSKDVLFSSAALTEQGKTCWKGRVDSHMWRDLIEIDSAVSLHVVLGVDLQLFVGVDWNQHGTDVRLTERRTPTHLETTFCNFTRSANYWFNSLLVHWPFIKPQFHNKNVKGTHYLTFHQCRGSNVTHVYIGVTVFTLNSILMFTFQKINE